MGDPKKPKKKFETPKKMWEKAGVETRRQLTALYGLKNKKEIWKAETTLRKKRQTARKLLALSSEERKKREKELLDSLESLGVLEKNSSLDDVLSLKVEALLDRRLQSIVVRNGMAATMKQARQLITHGHITVNGKKVSTPGYLVKKKEESRIGFKDAALGVKIKKAIHQKKEVKKIVKKETFKGEDKKEAGETKEGEAQAKNKEEKKETENLKEKEAEKESKKDMKVKETAEKKEPRATKSKEAKKGKKEKTREQGEKK